MSEMESRLTEAMKAKARAVEPRDEDAALDSITRRVDVRRHRALMVLGAAAAIAVVIGAIALVRRDDGGSKVNVTTNPSTTVAVPTSSPATVPATSPTTGSTPSSTSTTSPPTTATTLPASFPHVWPLDASAGYATPEEAAHSFFADYLGMTEEQLGQSSRSASYGGAQVEGFPRGPGSARTVVDLVQTSAGWVVVGAQADEIVVDDPLPLGGIEHPMHVSGRSVAFEAQLGLELRPGGSMTVVSTGTAMGGSSDMQPFATTIDPPAGDGPLVLLVFEGDASGAQTYSKVTVILLGAGQGDSASSFASS